MNNNTDAKNSAPDGGERMRRVQKNALPKRKMIVQRVGGIDRPFLICVILQKMKTRVLQPPLL